MGEGRENQNQNLRNLVPWIVMCNTLVEHIFVNTVPESCDACGETLETCGVKCRGAFVLRKLIKKRLGLQKQFF